MFFDDMVPVEREERKREGKIIENKKKLEKRNFESESTRVSVKERKIERGSPL